MSARQVTLPALMLLGAMGCAHRAAVPAPPTTEVKFAGARAIYRTYQASHNMCDAEPRWLADELSSVNALFSRYLRSTEKTAEDEWTSREVALLREAPAVLEPLLDLHARQLRAVRKCSFSRKAVFHDVLTMGAEVMPQVRAQLVATAGLAEYLDARRALRDWRERVKLERSEFASFCEPRSHEIYFAYEDEAGVRRIYFCDDGQVTYPAGSQTPEITVPDRLATRAALRRRYETLYVKKAKALPQGEVRVAPSLPPAPGSSTAAR